MNNETVTNVEMTTEKELKYLPGKYNKFAVFTFWLTQQLRQDSPDAADSISSFTNITFKSFFTVV